MRIFDLQVYIEVIKQKSISGGARSMRLTQPAVTNIIQALEAEVGCKLLLREPRQRHPLTPTVAGQTFLDYAQETLAGYQRTLLQMHRTEGPSGPVVLGSGRSATDCLLPGILRELRRCEPSLPIRTKAYTDSTVVHEKLDRGECNFGLSSFPGDRHTYRYKKLVDDPFVLIAPAAMELPGTITTRTLEALPLVVREPDSTFIRAFEGALQPTGRTAGDFNIVMEVYGNSAVARAVSMGTGCGFVTRSLYHTIASGHSESVKQVRITDLKLPREIGVLKRYDQPETAIHTFFWNFMTTLDWPGILFGKTGQPLCDS